MGKQTNTHLVPGYLLNMMTTSQIGSNKWRAFPWQLTTNAVTLLLAVKVTFFLTSQSQMRSAFLVSFVQDAFLLIAGTWLLVNAPRGFSSARLRRASQALSVCMTLALAAFSVGYSFFLLDLVSFPVSFFGVDSTTASFFAEYFLSAKLGLGLAAGVVALLVASWFFPRKIKRRRLPVAAAVLITLLFIPTALRPALNPLVYSVQDQLLLILKADSDLARLRKPTPTADLATEFVFLDRSSKTPEPFSSRYDRVIVLVMESVNTRDFTAVCQEHGRFLTGRHSESTWWFDNYYTLNLDSYTSLLAMVSSTFIPYQSYVDQERYEFINWRDNLLGTLDKSGYSTHFLTSYGEQQKRFVPSLEQWTGAQFVTDMSEKSDYTCIDSSKIEWACEDLAVLDELVQTLRKNPRPFLFQELVYGHTASWQEQTGIGMIEYYLDYFDTVIGALEENDLLDDTLLILTSDHGPRTDAYDPENYHIPLLLWATDLQQNHNSQFVSHLDFRDLLVAQLSGETYLPSESPIFTVGNSGELIYGKISADGSYGFIHNRMRNLRGNLSGAEAQKFNRAFQDYMDYFETLRP